MDTPIPLDDLDIEDGGTEAPSVPEHFSAYVAYLKRVEPLTQAQQLAMHEMANDCEEPAESRRWAQSRLWLDTLKFVLYVRTKLRPSMPFVRLDDMDVLQEGNLAAGLALGRWNPARGTLTTWLYPHVRGALLNHAVTESRIDQRAISLDAVVGAEGVSEALESFPGADADEPQTLGDLLTYDNHVFDDPETITEYGQVRKLLVEEHGANGWGDLAADFQIGDTNIRELAEKYAVSVPTIYNRMRKMGF